MQVAKWGNSLAVRLPAELVKELGLREGDKIEVKGDKHILSVKRQKRSDEILSELRAFRGRLPSTQRLSRDDVHER